MVPSFYVCSACKAGGLKLWRQYQTFADHIQLLCAACAEKDQDKPIDLSESDSCGWLVPAVPTLDANAPYWGYTSAPAEGCAWWKALPLSHEGEWKTKDGLARWMTFCEAMDLTYADPTAELLRVDDQCTRALVLLKKQPGAE